MYKLREERGFTLLEVIVVVVIVGVALPSLFILIGNVSYGSFRNKLMNTAVNHASSRLERIQAFKDENWDWYKTIENYEAEEDLADGFTRVTEIKHIDDWESTGYEAYAVTVSVGHDKLKDSYSVTIYLTLYSR